MKFTAKEDIEAPIDEVFRMLSDFGAMERAALRRGIEVNRDAPTADPVIGLTWNLVFTFRGKSRDARLALAAYDPPNALGFKSTSGGLDADGGIELVALSRNRTRMAINVELAAQTLSGRLLLQSLKLAKSNLSKRFKVRIADFASDLEDRHTRQA